MNKILIIVAVFCTAIQKNTYCQITDYQRDSLYINEVENKRNPDKVLHAEPLYIDLIRDLGARKGEKEWNIGLGLTDQLSHDYYEALIEYEWAPVDRLGLEVELPFSFYTKANSAITDSTPKNKLNSLKLATQWSFYINEKYATSMALGYINEFELSDFTNFGNPLIKGNVYNPFFIVAKRWGNNFHSLIYTGPKIEQEFSTNKMQSSYEVNSNFHYMISGTRNFIGIEFNKTFEQNKFDMTIRPQMRLGIADNLMIGIVGGIPLNKQNDRLSSFVRLIWEPNQKYHHISRK
jgi:hypothetical protein